MNLYTTLKVQFIAITVNKLRDSPLGSAVYAVFASQVFTRGDGSRADHNL